MKKVVLTLVLSLVVVSIFAQTSAPKRLKYVTTAPDGSVSMTIYDDSRDNDMKLESANAFYKYQIIDTKTSEPVYSAHNNGKECKIDKTKIAAGTYDLRLYTASFVITSKITISAARKLTTAMKEDIVAMND